jgi:hypothetical protein
MIAPNDVRYPGYSGAGDNKNVPASQWIKNKGPIPCGIYTIEPPIDTKTHGPYVLWLTPDPANEMFGRSAFGIHGDSLVAPGTASEGCIILSRVSRETIWLSGDHILEVKASEMKFVAIDPEIGVD